MARIPLMALLPLAWTFSVDLAAQSDDFDDANDSGWVRYSPLTVIGAPVTFSFPRDDRGGAAYRLQCPAPAFFELGPARGLSYRTDSYSDFFAAVDLVGWNNELDQTFGILFRAENIGFAATTGYVFNYNPQQTPGGRGQLQINRVAGERESGILGTANITLDPNRRYRLVLTAIGGDFHARIYDLLDLTLPLAAFTASDPTSKSGANGLFSVYLGTAVMDPDAGRSDSTFDNYLAQVQPPGAVSPPATIHGFPHMPQVVNRSPASRSNFYDAAKGVTFTATTLTTNRIDRNALRLILNGVDVTSKLAVSGSSSNMSVSFKGLSPNWVYDGRIVLEDFSGRRSTNEWTFDTFAEEYLDSPGVKVIEAEDYNYEGGRFQDRPPPSGMTSTGSTVNGGANGYFEQAGIQDVDYFDYSSRAGGGAPAEYRSSDLVGTQAGSIESGTSNRENPRQNDTRRRKYAIQDLPEYQVRGTEGGEWLNYTRVFADGDYVAFLRVGARAAQPVRLARVTSDPAKPNQTTSPLGTFHVPNTGLIVNYRYVPLTDDFGNPAVVHLSGRQTLRLTLGGAQQNSTQGTMTLNYLVFVPAPASAPPVLLESAAGVAGPYEPDPAAEAIGSWGFELAARGPMRFYRLRSGTGATQSYRITSIQAPAGKVVVRYEAR